MRNAISLIKILSMITALFLTNAVCAQSTETAPVKPITKLAPNTTSSSIEEKKSVPVTDKSTKKTVQDATINLQTTVTGNQEQPRVLYILPWQSPATDDVDFESLDNQQKAVFSHVEREELRRELESAGE